MTLEQLRDFGCNVDEGLQRCVNNEQFYLMLVNKLINSTDLSKLGNALESNDLETAFKEAHSLKGTYGNLSITPIYNVLVEMVEPLRKKIEMDYIPCYQMLVELYNKLKALQ